MAETDEAKGGYNVQFALFELKHKLELTKRREYSWAEVARLAGLHRNTIDRIAANQTARIDLETLAKLVRFFDAEGMPITAGDLFTTIKPVESNATHH